MAALQIADQGTDLLLTGVLTPRVTRHRDLLLAIRAEGLSGEREETWRRELDLAVAGLDEAAVRPHPSLRLERNVVTSFLGSAYR